MYGSGRPLVLLHGGLLTIGSFAGMLPALADDVVALLDELGLERADLFGFSLGGLTALEIAVRHPERLGRLVAASVHFRADGYLDEVRGGPTLDPGSVRMPTEADRAEMREAYVRVAPDPGHFAAADRAHPARLRRHRLREAVARPGDVRPHSRRSGSSVM
jgi:pimeloyl-ACP methyl ester carboxylesterase